MWLNIPPGGLRKHWKKKRNKEKCFIQVIKITVTQGNHLFNICDIFHQGRSPYNMPGTPWNAISHLPEEAFEYSNSCIGGWWDYWGPMASRACSSPGLAASEKWQAYWAIRIPIPTICWLQELHCSSHLFYLIPELGKNKLN